ncbi:hypothetical protein ARALYDRAFT_312475 [Arabidopsis lyrata subsp. lyrata]|uniref:KNOX1 domain-containing protein n=1 Tax=Arabidopsis lyrata subsp. lyrata TaxID=81972 RepID=D7KCJ6_ARALL|nr:protein KNATM isoform X1 [Arabidopsis lyrata subsp. lyrata]EFH69087.1 hypothetical protein ARALYDRAFT_312475 [Arabidopsis lyrata subsp. lyrata]|eukprot:XP_002892828.1 protein KNATM isoform X1 [Arabidopsis lyrata subsp. lyrata]
MDVKIDENSSLENMKQEINQNIKEEAEEEKEEILKKRISSHPLYGLLLHSHLNCLKVCSGDFDSPEIMNTADDLAISKLSLHPDSSSEATSSELDQFMVLILLVFPFFLNKTTFSAKTYLHNNKQHFHITFIFFSGADIFNFQIF